MDKFIRVKDKDTGHKRTIRESKKHLGNYQVLQQDAVNAAGEPLPPEYATAEPAPSRTTESLSSKSPDGQKAETKKESS